MPMNPIIDENEVSVTSFYLGSPAWHLLMCCTPIKSFFISGTWLIHNVLSSPLYYALFSSASICAAWVGNPAHRREVETRWSSWFFSAQAIYFSLVFVVVVEISLVLYLQVPYVHQSKFLRPSGLKPSSLCLFSSSF